MTDAEGRCGRGVADRRRRTANGRWRTTRNRGEGGVSGMNDRKATAVSCANIALIKYWGNRDHVLRLPSNPSLSMNLAGLTTTTTVEFDPALKQDVLILGGREIGGNGLERVRRFLDQVRQRCGDISQGTAPHVLRAALSASAKPPRGTKPSPSQPRDGFAHSARHDCAHLFA